MRSWTGSSTTRSGLRPAPTPCASTPLSPAHDEEAPRSTHPGPRHRSPCRWRRNGMVGRLRASSALARGLPRSRRTMERRRRRCQRRYTDRKRSRQTAVLTCQWLETPPHWQVSSRRNDRLHADETQLTPSGEGQWLPTKPPLALFRTIGGSEPHDWVALKGSNTQQGIPPLRPPGLLRPETRREDTTQPSPDRPRPPPQRHPLRDAPRQHPLRRTRTPNHITPRACRPAGQPCQQ